MIITLEQINEHKMLQQIAEQNDREYQEFLKINNLKQNWDTWDMFTEQKWNYNN